MSKRSLVGALCACAALVCVPALASGAPAPAHAAKHSKKHKKKHTTKKCKTVRIKGHKVRKCHKVTAHKKKPTSGKVVFDSGANLFKVNGSGGGRTQLTTGGGSGSTQYIEPSLSADGRRMVLQGPDSQLYTADGNAKNLHALTDGSMPTMLPRISPDGTLISYVTDFLMYAGPEITNTIEGFDGSNSQSFSQTYGIAGFAPGNRVFCNGGPGNVLTIAPVAQVGTGDQCPTVVANDSADPNALFGERPAFSPKGTLVVDSISEDGGQTSVGLFLFNASSGTLVKQLTNGNDTDAVFSPDGSTVLFDRGNDIYRVPAAGGAAKLFVANGQHPSWSR